MIILNPNTKKATAMVEAWRRADARGIYELEQVHARYSNEKRKALYKCRTQAYNDGGHLVITRANSYGFSCAYVDRYGNLIYFTAWNTYCVSGVMR